MNENTTQPPQLLYLPTHLACKNYADVFGENAMEHIVIEKDKDLIAQMNGARIIFVLEGEVSVFSGSLSGEFNAERIIFFPPASRVKFEAKERTELFVFRLTKEISLCREYSLTDLEKDILADKNENNDEIFSLPFNQTISHYLTGVIRSYKDGLRCIVYQELKLKEIFFILRGYYSKEDLHRFFNPMLSSDSEFTQKVWMNYRKAGSVGELAEMMNYSESHFHSKFREVLGVSALQWLNTQKARNIYFDLRKTEKTFAEISDEYHFASTSYLSTFCKRNFDLTPKEIRDSC